MRCFFTFLLLAFSTASFSQLTKLATPPAIITVGQVKHGGVMMAQLSYSLSNGDTLYTILFNDATYAHANIFKGIVFKEENGTVRDLYNTLKEAIKSKADAEIAFELGFDKVNVTTKQQGYFTLMSKDIDKLFGKG
jgi:hypothetical protein